MAPTPGPVPGPVGQVASAASEVQETETSTYLMTPRNSMTVTHTKGLLNMPGQNNCFLNSAVQVLWHLDIFRRSFRDLTGHACMAESCIFCALKELFTQFQYSQESALPPDALRHALAKTFCDQRRFQLGFMDDAAECFENILLRIHVHIANQESEDMCGDINCIPHQKFAMTLVEQPVCHTCGATSEPLPFTQMVHYVTTSALCSKALEIQKQGNGYSQDSFGKLLRLAGDVGDVRDCTSGCGSKIHIKKTLMNNPAIVSIGLVWDSECPSLEHITDVFHNIGITLQLKDMFHSVVDTDWITSTSHELVGVVTYYGKHYSTFFFHTKLRVWIYFDDATVREIGPRWEQVVEKCQRGHFQPLLLLFANPNGASLPTNSVPQDQPLKEEIVRRDSTSAKGTNQRQAVISKYLMFQNMCKNDENGNLKNQSFAATNQYVPKMCPGGDNNSCHMQQTPHDTHQITVKSQAPVITNSCVHPHNHSLYTYNNCIAGHHHPHSEYCVHHCQNSDYSGITHPTSNCTNTHVSKYSSSSHNHQFHIDPQELSKVNGGILSNLLASKYASLDNQHQQDIHQPVNSDFQCISNTAKPQEPTQVKKESLESSKDSDSAFAEDDSEAQDTYISRKAVENVLNLQKLQRQISLNRSYNHSTVGNRNSSSSLESFDNAHHNKLSTLHRDLGILETENLSCRRDSGSWSGDRNSSSSSSNASVESPFLSVVATKRLLLGPNNFHLPAGKGHLPEYSNVSASDHGYDSYSVSSSDSYPSVTGSPAKLDPRLTQIPEDWQEDLDKKLQMITVESSGPPDCDKLCAEADLLLAKSHDKEKEGDLVMAALLCDSAAARARAAMDAPYNNSRSLVSAKMKHSTCVMRSSCLYRRIKDNEENERRRQKGISGGHSRQSSRDSSHGRHSRQGSKDSTHAKQTSKENSRQTVEEPDNFGKNIEIYGTLPKKGSRRKIASSGSVKVKDDQIYKDFLDKQRQNVKLPSGSNDHSQKISLKPQNKHENPKSKFENSSEKQHKKAVADNAVPKSPVQKKQDYQPFLNNEDLEVNGKKWTLSKQLNFDRSCHGLSPLKDVDYISAGEAINRDLLSPLSPHDKKQHRVKRKLMGGFMKRKNRSLPDLREEQNLSDPMDRSFDDTVIQMPSTLTLPNGKLKKLDFQSDAHIQVTRGFHQPHHAFVKKDLTHRPLLMKVNPPNIQPAVLSSPKSKPTHILPSLPKKIVETKTKSNELSFTRDRPSKIPFMSPFQKDISSPPALSPLKPVDSVQPTTISPQKTSSPVLNSQMTVLGPKVEMEKTVSVLSVLSLSSPNEDLPLPSNPFLAELQAKRQQIIGSMSQKEKCPKTEREHLKPTELTLSSGLKPNIAKLSVISDGSSWLKELQSKQQQLLHKQNCQTRPLLPVAKDHRDILLSPTENSCAETFTRVRPKINIPRNSQNPKVENEEALSQSSESKSVESSSASSINSVTTSCDNTTARSVKDLASRFEKVFNNHQEMTSLSESSKVSAPKEMEKMQSESALSVKSCGLSPPVKTFSSNLSTDQDLHEKTHPVQHNENKSLENYTSEALPLAHSTNSFSENQSDSQSDSQIIRTSNNSRNTTKSDTFTAVPAEISNMSTQQRPQKPPDYETALQRLELIRTSPATSSELHQRISDSDCTPSSLNDTPAVSVLAEAPRKKQGPKKTVTFSDEVVLVSCADYDDSDFLPNPLLERVYQQHIQAGGSEIIHLNIPADCTALKTDSEYSCSDEKKEEKHHTAGHEESWNSNSRGIVPCHLCHNKYITPPSIYCPDCAFYMSRFQP